MALPEPPMAVAMVVDASLSLGGQWATLFPMYIGPLLKRLAEGHPGQKLFLAFICYATNETRPTPIVCKRFFHDIVAVTKILRDDYLKMGIGSTGSGKTGMAALEGLTAALEMFDTLLRSYPTIEQGRKSAFHVLHLTSTPVDDALNPSWNELSAFDSVTWDSLPDEFKKRHINYSCVSLASEIPALAKMHAAFDNPTKPWFNVPHPHAVLLSGYPLPGKGAPKRPHEATSQSPESKRQRVAPPNDAPLPSTPNTSAPFVPTSPMLASLPPPPVIIPSPALAAQPVPPLQSAPPPQITLPVQSSPPPPPHPQITPSAPAAASGSGLGLPFASMRPLELIDRYRLIEAKMQQLGKIITEARAKGDTQRAGVYEAEIGKYKSQYLKMKQIVTQLLTAPALASLQPQLRARLAATVPGAAGQPPIGMAGTGPIAAMSGAPTIPSAPPTMQPSLSLPDMNPGGPPFTPPQSINHARSASGDFALNMGAHNPNQNHMAPGPSMSPPNVNMMLPQANNNQPHMNQAMPGAMNTAQPPKSSGGMPLWQGPLCWSGVDNNNGKREMQTHVMAVSQNNGDFRVHTWPTSLMLTPTSTPAVPLSELQAWVKKTAPALCMFVPQQQPPQMVDKTINDMHFKSLIALLQNKKVYALAAWTLPNGSRNPACLIFPAANGLVGAFFPVDGIPEMPRPLNHLGMTLPPQVEAHLQKMPPEERNAFLARYVQSLRQRAALNNQNPMQSAAGASGHAMGMQQAAMNNGYMGMGQPQQQQQQQMPQMNQNMNLMNFGLPNMGQPGSQQQAGLPRPMQSNMPGFSNEIIQSFMQRNPGQDGQGG